MTQKLLSARQVKDLLDVDTSTIYRMAGDGRLAAIKVGRQWRFPADEIERLVNGAAAQTPASTPTSNGESLELEEAVVNMAAKALGVMMVYTDMRGEPLTPVANPCRRFESRAGDPTFIAECAAEWREFAEDPDLRPTLRLGRHGFECARSFVRSGSQLTGMVLVGGIAPEDRPDPDLYVLTTSQREHVLAALPDTAALLSRINKALQTRNETRSTP
jgi:excisionase family DNA binding protein